MALYRALARIAEGEHRDILLELASAEERHTRYWRTSLVASGTAALAAAAIGRHVPRRAGGGRQPVLTAR